MPNWTSVYDWVEAHPVFALRLERARVIGADAISEESLEIVDAEPEYAGGKIDPGFVKLQQVRAEHRLKLLTVWHPKKYGNRTVLAGDEENPLIPDTSNAKAELAGRLGAAVIATTVAGVAGEAD